MQHNNFINSRQFPFTCEENHSENANSYAEIRLTNNEDLASSEPDQSLYFELSGDSLECRTALEWILSPVDRQQAKDWAQCLLRTFGSLANALSADIDIITELLGVAAPAKQLKNFHYIMSHVALCKIRGVSMNNRWGDLIRYLQLEMGQLRIEQARVILFNKSWRFIADEILSTGDISEAACYPRQVARRCVVAHASAAILVHNHPSGNSEMSQSDRSITYAVQHACEAVGVHLFDHLVVCRDSYSSFRQNNPGWQ